ncbi:serine/threonine-protein kinase [Singulisphaera sp. PoT]|uniref:serine/threonine-protein kinase n=1 Tax=Singulisphaera sp. PoT TaxID=3411797 RepID=UPI003BF47AD3
MDETGPATPAAMTVPLDSMLSWQPYLDAVCDRFENAWHDGKNPNIHEYLADDSVPAPRRPALFRDLLQLERELRTTRGETPKASDYFDRFPAYATIIRAVFGEDRIGAYELIGPIGEGGMGIVYRARDRNTQRDVALKVIRPRWLDDSSAVDRFRLEAQLAARLDHEHIVPVYEAGQVDGQHFYAMRYVAGRSLADVIEKKPLDNRTAARCIEQVARAVDHAHTRNVLHRDIKPRNILIDESGKAYVTDFGLAKLLGQNGGGTLTTGSGGLGSPPYMSPEQWRDPARAGHATDIYSLGATLYEALTGTPPFHAESLVQLHVMVTTKEPPKPRTLNPKCDRDLETICLKCLEKEPSQRYTSALKLAEDLHNYLEGNPIKARRSGFVEKAAKWVRKHPIPTALIILMPLAVASVIFSIVLRSALARTEQSYELTREVIDKVSIFSEKNLRNHPRLMELLNILAEGQKDFLDRRGEDPKFRGEVADVLNRMARLMDLVGKKAEAVNAYNEALELRLKLAAQDPSNPKRQAQLAETYHNLGIHYSEIGKLDEGLARYRDGLRIRIELANKYPDDRRFQSDLARSYGYIGDWERENGRYGEAKVSYDKAKAIREKLAKTDASDNIAKFQLARSYNNQGHLDYETHEREGAIAAHQQAATLQKELYKTIPKDYSILDDASGLIYEHWNIVSDLAWSYFHLGLLHSESEHGQDPKSEHGKQAVGDFNEAVKLLEELIREQPGAADLQAELGRALNRRGLLTNSREDIARSEDLFNHLSEGNPGVVRFEAASVRNLAASGVLDRREGHEEEGRAKIEQAFALQKKLVSKQLNNPELRRDLEWIESLKAEAARHAPQAGADAKTNAPATR